MIYVALLRGINVGGKNKVSMPVLKDGFESLGFEHVQTYINSGNIIFVDNQHNEQEIIQMIEQLILELFHLEIKVLVRSKEQIAAVINHIKEEWLGNKEIVSNIMFLFDEIDDASILDDLVIKENIDDVWYIPGTLFWIIPRSLHTKSGASRFAARKEYKLTTIRNANTVMKIFDIMNVIGESL